MSYKGPPKVQKVMVQPINLIFRYLQNRSRVEVWIYENVNLRIEGHIVGFDEYMNLVLDDAEEYHVKTKNRKTLGRIMMKGDNITLIKNVNPAASGKSAISFMERCISYIGDNAAECVKTNAFLNLPKDALVKLISSDYLCLEEEDVWRAVLGWAKQRAGVTQPTAHWAEEERARVCHHLTPLMSHVRFLLIDSKVFAEEVEPTGAVPIELSLEHYRRAALQGTTRGARAPPAPILDADKRLQPRLSVNLFPGSVILQHDKSPLQTVLNNWYGAPKQTWRLLYRASTHGPSAATFHSHCDGIAHTMVIVLTTRGEICGGFSDVAWVKTSHKGGYISSEKAFVFTLHNSTGDIPTKFDIVKKPYAVCYHSDCGPIFGAGADLLIASDCTNNSESYSNTPHSYGGDQPGRLVPDYNFTVRDYEVFTTAPQTPAKHERF